MKNISISILVAAASLNSFVAYSADLGAFDKDCGAVFVPNPATMAKDSEGAERLAQASRRFNEYFHAANASLLERSEILDLVQVALLAEEHVLLMGPPGNAKSLVSDWVLGNIKEAHGSQAGKSSYYRIQMTPETTMSETHGSIDPKEIFESGRIVRHYEEGMLLSRNVFIDEIFDARANAQRNILGMLNERQHAQGTEIVKGKIETAIGATNRYLDEVYEKSGDQGPKALLDRFSFNVYVPGELELSRSNQKMISRSKTKGPAIPELSFDDIEQLRAMVPLVEIPESVEKFVSVLSFRMKGLTEAMEQAAIKTYKKKLQNGETPAPPYRATKYHSPRTLGKAGGILKAYVVQAWAQSGGARPLTATIEDVKFLRSFFTLNGPNDAFVEAMAARTSNPYERSQLSSILQERKVFDDIYADLIREMNSVIYDHALVELDAEVAHAEAGTPAQKEKLTHAITEKWIDVASKADPLFQADMSGKEVGRAVVVEAYRSHLRELLGSEEALEAYLSKESNRISEMKREAAAAEQKRVKAEQEAKRMAEAEAARARARAERQKKIDELTSNYRLEAFNDIEKNFDVVDFEVPLNYSSKSMPAVTVGDKTLFFSKEKIVVLKEGKPAQEIAYAAIPNETFRLALQSNAPKEFIPFADGLLGVRVGTHFFVLDSGLEVKSSFSVGFSEKVRLAPSSDRKGLAIFEMSDAEAKVTLRDIKSGEHKEITIAGAVGMDATQAAMHVYTQVQEADPIVWAESRIYGSINSFQQGYSIDLKTGMMEFQSELLSTRGWRFTSVPKVVKGGSSTLYPMLQSGADYLLMPTNLKENSKEPLNISHTEIGLTALPHTVLVTSDGKIFAGSDGRQISFLDLAARKRLATPVVADGEFTVNQIAEIDPTTIAVRLKGRASDKVRLFKLKPLTSERIEALLEKQGQQAADAK